MLDFSKLVKVLISLFILTNLSAFIYFNYPGKVTRLANKILNLPLKEEIVKNVKKPLKKIRTFLRFIGLSNRWNMFCNVNKSNYWFLIRARYKNSKEIVLPLPLQTTNTTILDRYFFSFREPKFLISLFKESLREKSYAHFLCRTYKTNEGVPIEKVIFEYYERNIINSKNLKKSSTYLETLITKEILDTFSCNNL